MRLRRDYVANDPVYFVDEYVSGDTVLPADAPFAVDACKELAFEHRPGAATGSQMTDAGRLSDVRRPSAAQILVANLIVDVVELFLLARAALRADQAGATEAAAGSAGRRGPRAQ
jgi:hypothetical protein